MGTRHTNRTTGTRGEDVAVAHLERVGLRIVTRNWRIAAGDLRGELDVVAQDPATSTLVVVEVKTRRHGGSGGPLAAVGPDKQRRLRRLAGMFLRQTQLAPTRQVRFDVVGVLLDGDEPVRLEHVRGAF